MKNFLRKNAYLLVLMVCLLMFSSGSASALDKPLPPVPPVIKEMKMLQGSDTFSIMNPTFSKDGKYLAAFFNGEKTIRIYDTSTGEVVAELTQNILYNDKYVDGMAFTGENNDQLIIMRAEAPLKVLNWKDKTLNKELDLGVTGMKITDFAFTPDQKYLVIAKENGIDIWNYPESKKEKSFFDGQKINAVDISSDGKYLIFAKAGKPKDSVGTIDLTTLDIGNMPLSNLPVDENNKLPDYEVHLVDFTNGHNTIAGYLNLPAGTFMPDGPAGVYLINTEKGSFSGPTSLSDFRLAMAKYLSPFRGVLTSSFNFGQGGKVTSSLDFINPMTMEKMKTYPSTEFKAPMLAINVSPDAKMMAAALKEADGVKLYLFSLNMPQK
ncbi:MAG: WD40 repeat domain-containing protein [Vampirovibrionia bacterium]